MTRTISRIGTPATRANQPSCRTNATNRARLNSGGLSGGMTHDVSGSPQRPARAGALFPQEYPVLSWRRGNEASNCDSWRDCRSSSVSGLPLINRRLSETTDTISKSACNEGDAGASDCFVYDGPRPTELMNTAEELEQLHTEVCPALAEQGVTSSFCSPRSTRLAEDALRGARRERPEPCPLTSASCETKIPPPGP